MGQKRIWANLLHVGTNMWSDRLNTPEHPYPDIPKRTKDKAAFGRTDILRCDDRVWEDLTGTPDFGSGTFRLRTVTEEGLVKLQGRFRPGALLIIR